MTKTHVNIFNGLICSNFFINPTVFFHKSEKFEIESLKDSNSNFIQYIFKPVNEMLAECQTCREI